MQGEVQSPRRSRLLLALLIFVISYGLFLGLWVAAKGPYGRVVTAAASQAVAVVKHVEIEETTVTGEGVRVRFVVRRYPADLIMDVDVKTASYTFNVPLTLAIMAAFFPTLRKKLIYMEALGILLLVHGLTVFFSVGEDLSRSIAAVGYGTAGAAHFVWQFFGQFLDAMVIRFEPFLIGAYLYFRK